MLSTGGTLVRLTMVTSTPYSAGLQVNSFSCFRSQLDRNVVLSFGRPFPINIPGSTIETSTSLPDGTTALDNGQAVTQYLPSSVNATGLFYCQGSSRGQTTRVYSIIHSFYSKSVAGRDTLCYFLKVIESNYKKQIIPYNLNTSELNYCWLLLNDGTLMKVISYSSKRPTVLK